MSHSTTDRLQHSDDRMSWLSLPSIANIHPDESEFNESEAHHQRLSILSPVSRPQSFACDDDRAPISHDAASVRPPIESDGLLETSRDISRRSSTSSNTHVPSLNRRARTVAVDDPSDHGEPERFRDHALTWLPTTLQRPFLILLALISLLISVILTILCWYSAKHHGLGKDDGSLSLVVGWRYVPTLIAVLFTQALVMVAEDVKRTEAFARMAQLQPIEAQHTLLYTPRVWWKSVLEGFSRKRCGGHRRWILAFSSLAAGISILVVSTFSSSLLIAKEVAYKQPVSLQRYNPDRKGNLPLNPTRDTYLHTISSYSYNTTTSIWVDDSHVVLPFTTAHEATGSNLLHDGLWEAETMIMQMDNECVSLSMMDKTVIVANYTYADASITNRTFTVPSKGFKLRSADGCEVQLQTPIALDDVQPGGMTSWTSPDGGFQTDAVPQYGGMIWTNMSSLYVPWPDLVRQSGQMPRITRSEERVLKKTFIYDLSDQCRGRDLLLVSLPWFQSSFALDSDVPWNHTQEQYWDNFTARAEVCTPKIYGASLPVQQSVTNGIFLVSFDRSEFAKYRKPISKALIDLDRLNDLAFHDSWSKYMTVQAGHEDNQGYEGVSMLIGQHFSLNLTTILSNNTFSSEATRLRSRFFNELVLSSVLTADAPTLESVDGQVTMTDRRIMVVTEIAITLIVLFLLAFSYLLSMFWSVSIRRRPLCLQADPATIMGATLVSDMQSSLTSNLRILQGRSQKEVKAELSQHIYIIDAGLVTEATPHLEKPGNGEPVRPAKKLNSWPRKRATQNADAKDWRPSMLHKRWLTTLLVVLIALVVTLMVLRQYANENRLYRTAFVYQVKLGLFNTSFSPHSVIATLVAVVIALSWDSIDKPMRTLQPYLSMTRGTSAAPRGISLSYQSSYWLWASGRAFLRRHWILALVTIGTTLAQILVVSMAAIFERQAVLQARPTQEFGGPMYSYALRQEPFTFRITLASRPFYLEESLLNTTHADWLYTALDEIKLANAPPVWTKDEWVFTPVSLTRLPNTTTVSQEHGNKDIHVASSGLSTSPANVTITTSALRSRLECNSIRVPTSGWLDRAEDVFMNHTNNPTTGWVLPPVLFPNDEYKTPVFTVPRRMACCTNGTNAGGQSAIAYWSSSSPMTDERPAEPVDENGPTDLRLPNTWTSNFAIKWIVGRSSSTIVSGADPRPNMVWGKVGHANETLIYFIEEPHMSIMSCSPVIEHASASITIARSTSQILQAKILEEPQPAPGAWDYPWDITYEEPSSNRSKGNVSYGHFFMSQLLTAPNIIYPPVPSSWLVGINRSVEDLSSERFSIRDLDKGLNMDFMSYANYHMANQDPLALLNTTTLMAYSEKTFQTFFKHFAATGKWNYGGTSKSSVYDNNDHGFRDAVTINGTFTERIEVLAMNETATWLSLSILILLIVILIVLIISLQIVYPITSMQHHVECLADVLLMVAGSDEFAGLVHKRGLHEIEKSGLKTKLGWFKDKRGVVRWGIEVADRDVEWVYAPEEAIDDTEDRGAFSKLLTNLRRRR